MNKGRIIHEETENKRDCAKYVVYCLFGCGLFALGIIVILGDSGLLQVPRVFQISLDIISVLLLGLAALFGIAAISYGIYGLFLRGKLAIFEKGILLPFGRTWKDTALRKEYFIQFVDMEMVEMTKIQGIPHIHFKMRDGSELYLEKSESKDIRRVYKIVKSKMK